MRALTIWQPYATLIVCGLKRFETRSWATTYRGPLVIHAAKQWDDERLRDADRVSDLVSPRVRHTMTTGQFRLATTSWVDTLGCALGVVDLTDCRQMNDGGSEFEEAVGTFGHGRFGWECSEPRVFDSPVPCAGKCEGKQGLWTPPEEVMAQVFDMEITNA